MLRSRSSVDALGSVTATRTCSSESLAVERFSAEWYYYVVSACIASDPYVGAGVGVGDGDLSASGGGCYTMWSRLFSVALREVYKTVDVVSTSLFGGDASAVSTYVGGAVSEEEN